MVNETSSFDQSVKNKKMPMGSYKEQLMVALFSLIV